MPIRKPRRQDGVFYLVPVSGTQPRGDGDMNDLRSQLRGLWLPLITPFRDGAVDEPSLRRLVRHYAGRAIDGFILAATSGEGLNLDDDELERIVALVRAELAGEGRALPVCLGLAGAGTRKMLKVLDRTASWPIDGYLVSCPYYVRPSQRGLWQHFSLLANQAARPRSEERRVGKGRRTREA